MAKKATFYSGTFSFLYIAFFLKVGILHQKAAQAFAWINSNWLCMYDYLYNVNLKLLNDVYK